MLHKSFKPAKCKTALKLAASRIKLLKNKKDVQVRQLKGELAKLLEAGQDQTARIRVEHLVREEKSKEAYELIEIFCELIVARLPMIESQKNCPIDLKEAVSSVIFASPRCGDIPELVDVRKHFKAKYGKEFVSAAVELRPECGVNRMLVEKLSAKAPDGQNKIKILSAIAAEHNVKWDPKSFGDSSSNPPADLLNGPDTFEKASKIHIQMEPIGVQPAFDHNNKGSPSVHVPFKSDERQYIPDNSPQHNLRSSLHSLKSDSTDANTNQKTNTGHYSSEKSSGINAGEGMTFRDSNSGDQNNYSSGRQYWNMDFKDATSAAQAAAESAERASLAARAAAELSSRGSISRQCSSKLQKASSNNSRAERPQEHPPSNMQNQVASVPRRSSMMNDKWVDNDTKSYIKDDAGNSFDPSLKKSSASDINVYTSKTNFGAADTYSLENSFEPKIIDYPGCETMEKQAGNYDFEYVSDQPHGTGSEKISSLGETTIANDPNIVPSLEKLRNDADENPFAIDKTNEIRNTVETSFKDDASVVFDDYGPDDDFELGGDHLRKESILEFSSLEGKMPINLSATDPWLSVQNKYVSPEKSVSHSQIFEESTPFPGNLRSFEDPSQSHDFLPATYDHSDGPSSESEEEKGKSEIVGKNNSVESSNKQSLYSEKPEWTRDSDHGFAGSSFGEKRSTIFPLLSSNVSLVHEAKERSSPRSSPDIIQDTLEESTSESHGALSFGKLKGGLRNQKGHRRPYVNDLPSRQVSENCTSKTEQSTSISSSTASASFRSNATSQETFDVNLEEKTGEEKDSRAKSNSFYPYLGDSKDKFSEYTLRSDQESYSNKVDDEISKKSTSRVAVKYPGLLDDDDSEEDSPRQKMNSPRPVVGLSRRTKIPPKSPNSYLEDSYGSPRTLDDGSDGKVSRSYYASTATSKLKTQTKYSDHLAHSEQPQSSNTFKQPPETNRSFDEEKLKSSTKGQSSNAPLELNARSSPESSKSSFSREKVTAPLKTKAKIGYSEYLENSDQPQPTKTSKLILEPKGSFRGEKSTMSSTKELPSNPSPKLENQGNSESFKEKISAGEKASHVHPKLPDYDDFTAHFLSLRQNRK